MTKSKIPYLLLALLVTFLWVTSFIIIKIYIQQTSPLQFAAFRYVLASVILLTITFVKPDTRNAIRKLHWKDLLVLAGYGSVFIFLTQGAGYLSLNVLPPVTISFVLNFTSILVAVFGYIFLKEQINRLQTIFITVAVIGGLIYFLPLAVSISTLWGYLFLLLALLSNSVSSIWGRFINRAKTMHPLVITSVSMGVGALLLLTSALVLEGWTSFSSEVIVATIWLAVVNTALAFTLWNTTLREITALESSIILNTFLPQLAILSIIFLDDIPTPKEWIGLVLIVLASFFVQYFRNQNPTE